VPLGCLTEICGQVSSGRTSVLLALIAECMRRDEICALVDTSESVAPRFRANLQHVVQLVDAESSSASGRASYDKTGVGPAPRTA